MRARDTEPAARLAPSPPAEPAPAPEAAPTLAPTETPETPDAERLYAQLSAAYPGTREEVIARVLRGQALLDNLGRPGDALTSFDAYLRDQPNGALAEQARAGRAQALWLLGREGEEAAAWRDLLAAHPRSLHAALARSRLAALSRAGE
jgi:hypothetical protein